MEANSKSVDEALPTTKKRSFSEKVPSILFPFVDCTCFVAIVEALRATCRRVAGAQGFVARIDAALAALLGPTELKSPISVDALIAEFLRRLEDLDGEINTIPT